MVKYYVVTVYDPPAKPLDPLKTEVIRVRYGTYPEFEAWLKSATYLPPAVPRSALK